MLLFSIYIFAHYTDVLTVHDCPADEAPVILHLSLISLKASVQNKLTLNRFDILANVISPLVELHPS